MDPSDFSDIFCEVLLPLPLPGTFTYRIPADLSDTIIPGLRVVVNFGRKTYSGLVREVHKNKPSLYEAKEIVSMLSPFPMVNALQFEFWDWMAAYYLCQVGEIMEAAMPSVFKLSSESRIMMQDAYSGEIEDLSKDEVKILDALLLRKSLSVRELSGILQRKRVFPLLKGLSDRGIVGIVEDLKEKRKPRLEAFYRLHPAYVDEAALIAMLDGLERRSPRKAAALHAFLRLKEEVGKGVILHSSLVAEFGIQGPAIKGLVEKGILLKEYSEISRLPDFQSTGSVDSIIFSEAQAIAFAQIQAQHAVKDVVLLHGVTSSGKTEIYIHLIRECLAQAKQVLYLLPEIALTTQTIGRLRKYFGNRVGVYHSRLNDQERAEVWLNVAGLSAAGEERYDIILGARSSLFLPFENLGLVIVDEEHDVSYKQQDTAPRYQGRDAAVMLARLHEAKVLLGSATPCLESYANAVSGKYGIVKLEERYGGIMLPEVHIVDMKSEQIRRRLHGHFSKTLLDQIGEALRRKEQIILFQNRRGFSLLLRCQSCQWSPGCHNCDVTLTYHKHDGRLHCHYCGYTTAPPAKCPHCGSTDIKMLGFGTEKLEEELPIYFPSVHIARLDVDSMRSKHAFQKVLFEFEAGKIDVLIGTQMVTKGLDFDNVSLVGIMNADNLMSFPDFRSHERGFQLMAQVSGRSGRRSRQGKVMIQTWVPTHPIIKKVKANDYAGFFKTEMEERREFLYPPYGRLILITVKHCDINNAKDASNILAAGLRKDLGKCILGPEFPAISRQHNQYLRQILVKFGRNVAAANVKDIVRREINKLQADPRFRSVRIVLDVDPY